MMQRDLTLTWKGEAKTLVPTFRFLRKVDASLQADPDRSGNLFSTALVVNQGGKAIMDVPIVMAMFLNEAGFEGVTEEDCWRVVTAITTNSGDAVAVQDYRSFALALTNAIIPDLDLGKNPDAPASKKTGSRGKSKPRRRSTGRAAT